MARALGEAECAHCLGTLVLICSEEVIKPCVAYVLHEPLSGETENLVSAYGVCCADLGGGGVQAWLTYRVQEGHSGH